MVLLITCKMTSCESCGHAYTADSPERMPKRLPCLDVFCSGCITKLRAKNLPCPNPKCALPLNLPDTELQVDQMTMELVASALREKAATYKSVVKILTCDDCMEDEGKTTEATHWCDDCEAHFCGKEPSSLPAPPKKPLPSPVKGKRVTFALPAVLTRVHHPMFYKTRPSFGFALHQETAAKAQLCEG